ncbi:MAG: PAS domain S-box protein [Actinomycetota bacterium]
MVDPDGISKEDLAHAVAEAPIGLAVTDARRPGNPVVWINPEFTRITGYEAADVLGRSLHMLRGRATAATSLDEIDAALAEARPASVELLNYRKNGQPFWVRLDIRPVVDDTGQLVQFVGSITDMTERRLAEDATRESEERLRAITEALPLPMLRLRDNGIIIQANALAHQAWGVAPGTLTGRSTREFAGDEGFLHFCEALDRDGAVERWELRSRREDGAPIWVLASGRRFTVRGETRELVIFQDVTELKRREAALTRANEQAESTIRARMRFLAAASHDLRQPLQAMALFASALENHVSTAQGRAIVQSLNVSLRGMEEMFDSLLDMSRLDAGVMKAEPQVFLVGDVFETVEASYGPQARAAGLDLRVVPTSLAVRSDPRLVQRIVGNFLSNAIRYTRQGRILVGCRRHAGNVRVVVCDTGPGIPEDQRMEIFKEFRRGEHAASGGRGGGMGLGLSIVVRLARLLGHRIDVHSVDGKGSAFSVELPLAEELAEPADDDHAAGNDVDGAVVVVVDDDPDIRDALALQLDQWGARPVIADSAEAVLAELDARGLRPDVLLVDLHLRGDGSGVAAIEAIRSHTGTTAPVFVFTGDTELPAGSASLGLPVLRKPIDPGRLRAVLAEALAG